MKTANFFGKQISRLLLGDNPMNGHSYITDLISGEEMNDYHTVSRIVETYFEAEDCGITAMIPLASPKTLTALKEYRRQGGKMDIIFQFYPGETLAENLPKMMELDPIGIYHQGTTTDFFTETHQEEKLFANLRLIREAGVAVGFGTHVPEFVERSEREGWDVDFYMTCLYNARRDRHGEPSGFITGKTKAGLIFYPEDRPLMLERIRLTKKPCIAFKIFAGGQAFLSQPRENWPNVAKEYIASAYAGVKDGDFVCIGVFNRDFDQLKLDCQLTDEILG